LISANKLSFSGSITIGNLGIAMLEPSLPLWMMESWSATSFERGAAFLVFHQEIKANKNCAKFCLASLRFLFDWHQHIWPIGTQNWPVRLLLLQ
jgi:hypothetical protein